MAAPVLETPRLRLRGWRAADLPPFAALNADPVAMEHLPGPLSHAESDAMAGRIAEHFARRGFGFWAVEAPGVADFLGFVGLAVPRLAMPFGPCVEIGWRLAAAHWGKGYATEAARAALEFGFRRLGLDEIVAYTVPANARSRAVMERLGMRHAAGEAFDHPALPEGHPLRRHELYRLPRAGALPPGAGDAHLSGRIPS
jgi:RimJ/RimL family protein N-acetyltransferase